VLSTLAESGPLTQIELGHHHVDRPHRDGYLIDELETQTLAERVRSPQDRRAFLIHLTPSGPTRGNARRPPRWPAPPTPS